MERGKRWFYPTFFRRLRRWVSGRGAAAWYSLYCGAQRRLFYLFTLHYYLFPLIVGRGFPDAPTVRRYFVGRDDSARQTTSETHPHLALRATFPLSGGRF